MTAEKKRHQSLQRAKRGAVMLVMGDLGGRTCALSLTSHGGA